MVKKRKSERVLSGGGWSGWEDVVGAKMRPKMRPKCVEMQKCAVCLDSLGACQKSEASSAL